MIDSLDNEVWKDIEDYEGIYQISNIGRVKSLRRYITRSTGGYWSKEKVLAQSDNGNGYRLVSLVPLEGKKYKKNHYIHRLVAQAFIPNPNGLPEINHKDSDNLSDNHVDKLEWCDRVYNCNYGEHNKKLSESKKGCKSWNKGKHLSDETKKRISDKAKERYANTECPKSISIICLNNKQLFNSIKEASIFMDCDKGSIGQVCMGKKDNIRGLKFMYC